jgi:hypothetical protein
LRENLAAGKSPLIWREGAGVVVVLGEKTRQAAGREIILIFRPSGAQQRATDIPPTESEYLS